MKLEELTHQETLDWLLEKDNPSVRHFTLTKLLGKPESDAETLEAKREIMATGVVPKILGKQNEDGSWGEPANFYLEKYTGTVWQLLILAELGADPADPRVKKACEFILQNSQDRESSGFAINRSAKLGGGRHSEVIPCLTGNMVFSLVWLGCLEDERIQKGIEWIARYQRADDGVPEGAVPSGWPYDKYEMCWGRHTCHMGVVKALKALSAIPEAQRAAPVREKIAELSEYLLLHHIYKKSHDPGSVSKPGWLKPGFPLMYQDDILEILEILTSLGYKDPRMGDALEILVKKKNAAGRWVLENTFNGRTLACIEEKGKESKWITAKAVYVLMNN